MKGLMQDWPLVVPTIIDHARDAHGAREIVTRGIEGPIRRYTIADLHSRARRAAKGLTALGVKLGDRVATLAWNTDRHLEMWYGVMGIGAICHTVNPRLFPEQIAYIINHAEDDYIFTDTTFLPILEAIQDQLTTIKKFFVLTDAQNMPDAKLRNVVCYEDWIGQYDDDFQWADFDESTAAGLCYTSGTTGNPKGVLYSHRSNVIHTLLANSASAFGLTSLDSVLPVVPMFHANAWGLTFAVPSSGAKLVLPGMKMDGESLYELLEGEQVTVTAAVPTLWLALLEYLENNDKTLSSLKSVVIGGSACPQIMIEKFEQNYGVAVHHAWGMTETSPIGTVYKATPETEALEPGGRMKYKLKQGRAPYGVEMKIIDDKGTELPHDGVAFGHLMVRGATVAKGYFKGEGGKILDDEGWFDTGDVSTIDPLGFMQITDRSKDVIKSGGEWISTIDIENLTIAHPDVVEAAVIGREHPKWNERPLLIVVPKDGSAPTREEILAFLDGKIAKWWMPNDVVFIDEIPHTATGKIQKMTLREIFKDYQFPD